MICVEGKEQRTEFDAFEDGIDKFWSSQNYSGYLVSVKSQNFRNTRNFLEISADRQPLNFDLGLAPIRQSYNIVHRRFMHFTIWFSSQLP